MDRREADLILREAARRALRPDPSKGLFAQQLALLNDPSPLKAALCTRRAGKSYLAGTMLYRSSFEYKGSTQLYVALTRESAENILWPVLREINEKYALGADLVDSELKAYLPNESRIWLVGADMKNFIPRLLGGKYPLAIIDEAQSFRAHIEELIDDVLSPAAMDYQGQICMFGTPGPIPAGYYYDTTEKGMNGFSLHKWGWQDNPHLKDPHGFVQRLMERKKWTKDNPTYRRQYLGEWVLDLDALVYKYKEGRNDYDSRPDSEEWHSILGVDYGWNDKTAFAVISYNPRSPYVFIEHCEGRSEMIPSEVAGRLGQLIERFKPVKIVADTGGLGKTITEEMIRRYGIPIHAAQKTEKLSWISLMNGDFIDGNLKVHSSLKELRDQYQTLTKDDDKGLEDPSLPNDLCDATLYAYREAKAYAFELPKIPPKTKEDKWAIEEERLLQAAEKAYTIEKDTPWWER